MVEVITARCLVSLDDNYITQRQIQNAERPKLCVARRIETKTQNPKRQCLEEEVISGLSGQLDDNYKWQPARLTS